MEWADKKTQSEIITANLAISNIGVISDDKKSVNKSVQCNSRVRVAHAQQTGKILYHYQTIKANIVTRTS